MSDASHRVRSLAVPTGLGLDGGVVDGGPAPWVHATTREPLSKRYSLRLRKRPYVLSPTQRLL